MKLEQNRLNILRSEEYPGFFTGIGKQLLCLAIFAFMFLGTPALFAEDADAPAKTDTASKLSPKYHKKLLATADSDSFSFFKDSVKTTPQKVGEKKYLFVYYSASWCPPCRKFTPVLVDFYNANYKNGDFDLILVSCDRNEEAAMKYMQDYAMPWLGVKLETDLHKAFKNAEFCPKGIPRLFLFDKSDKLLAEGRENVMQKYFEDSGKKPAKTKTPDSANSKNDSRTKAGKK